MLSAEIDGEKRYIWGNSAQHDLVPAADLTTSLVIDHRGRQRQRARVDKRLDYYSLRDDLGVEALA